ncbi:MAG: hypothetical protein V1704_00435 [Candidatus Vogelbacteria bacterium]
MSMIVMGQTISRFQKQINRLERLGIPRLFGIENDNWKSWLAKFGVTESSLTGKKSFIGLPVGLIPVADRWIFWQGLCPNLELNSEMIETATKRLHRGNLPTEAYVVREVSFDIWSETAMKAVKDWPRLQVELSDAKRVGLTSEELATSLAYDPNHHDTMLALGSVEDDVVPCLEPVTSHWKLSLYRFRDFIDEKGQWVSPFGGAGRVVAPTAKQ